jgi:hypothetical protein
MVRGCTCRTTDMDYPSCNIIESQTLQYTSTVSRFPSIELTNRVQQNVQNKSLNHYVRSTLEKLNLPSRSIFCACRFKLRFGVVIFLAILALHGSSHRRRLARCQCTVALLSGVLVGTVPSCSLSPRSMKMKGSSVDKLRNTSG